MIIWPMKHEYAWDWMDAFLRVRVYFADEPTYLWTVLKGEPCRQDDKRVCSLIRDIHLLHIL